MIKLVLLSLIHAALAIECRPEGPVFPRPHNLDQSDVFRNALANFTATLDAAFRSEIRTGWDLHNASLSVALVGLDQAEPTMPLWEYHRLAPGNVNGTQTLDRHSQYLIGSISKVITNAVTLRSGVNLDDPITKYLPELDDDTSLIDWNSISLRALGGHLAGIPPNYGFSEYYTLQPWFEALGFPPLNTTAYPPCGVIGLNTECTRTQFLTGLLTADPVAPPETRPVYSNIAYTLLSYALEAATGKNYTTLLTTLLTDPLHMPSTAPSPGTDARAVIPPGPSTWGSDYGDAAPGGGLVSTLADLSSLAHAILSRNPALGTESEIRAWLHPRSFAGGRDSAVGWPWEIFRPPPGLLFTSGSRSGSGSGAQPGSGPGDDADDAGDDDNDVGDDADNDADNDADKNNNNGDDDETGCGSGGGDSNGGGAPTVTIHAKDGAAYGYHARLALLDAYGVGMVLLSAGSHDVITDVFDAALRVLVPGVHAAAAAAARREYTGRFAGVSTEETGAVGVEAEVGFDGASLMLEGLGRNGTDVLAGMGEIFGATLFGFLPSLGVTGVFRLYPSEVERRGVLPDGTEVVEEDWRVWYEMERDSQSEMPGSGISEHDCLGWTLGDWLHYGSESLDRVVFVKDANTGEVLGLDVPFLRTQVMEKS